jgi:hypothetical protein
MSDRIDREIEEILNRLDEFGSMEDMSHRAQGPARVSRRWLLLASLAVVVLVGAGLFFGLVYPSLGSAGSDDGETRHESISDQIGEGHLVDEAGSHGSVGEEMESDGESSEHGLSDPTEDRGEHHREGSEQH